eukprot:scaffold967_cov173-Ochromonas_danica.AAC.19
MIWRLEKDVLHCIIKEWLEWKDISQWDVASLGRSRGEWLAVLKEMTWSDAAIDPLGLSFAKGSAFTRYIRWILHRHILLHVFPLNLSRLESFRSLVDKAYTAIRDVVIYQEDDEEGSGERDSVQPLEDTLPSFLDRCVRLQSLKVCHTHSRLDEVFSAVNQHVSCLTALEFRGLDPQQCDVGVKSFLQRYKTSLKEVKVSGCVSGVAGDVLCWLEEEDVRLRRLSLDGLALSSSLRQYLLLRYLSSNGIMLEHLHIEDLPLDWTGANEILDTVRNHCVHLKSLKMKVGHALLDRIRASLRFSSLYRSLPQLQTLDLGVFRVEVIAERRHVILSCCGDLPFEEDWIHCLLFVLRQGYTLTITTSGVYMENDVFSLLIEHLHPYLVDLMVRLPSVNDELFQELMKMCCCLVKLSVFLGNSSVSDRVLQAIAQHGSALKELVIHTKRPAQTSFLSYNKDEKALFSDEAICAMIQACQTLVCLDIPFAGINSIRALARLTRLQFFSLRRIEESADVVASELFQDTLKWSPSLQMGGLHLFNGDYFELFKPTRWCGLAGKCYRRETHNTNTSILLTMRASLVSFSLANAVEVEC